MGLITQNYYYIYQFMTVCNSVAIMIIIILEYNVNDGVGQSLHGI